ncbi:MAG: agmatinase family protein [Halodesulfurarchaeum sp.]
MVRSTNRISLSEDATALLSPYNGYNVPVDDPYETNFGEIVQRYPDADTADVGILGVPFDTAAVAGARGSREGPNGIRDKMPYWTAYNPELDIDYSDSIDVVDFGNVTLTQTGVEDAHEQIEIVTTELFKTGVAPVVLGGDHSITYPAAKGLLNVTDGDVGVINIDAHHDVRHSYGGELSNGTPFRRLLEDDSGKVSHENFVELGLSGWHNSKGYVDWVRDNGGEIITARDIHFGDIDDAIERALDVATDGTEAVYLSVDIDALDPGDALATAVPSPGGLRTFQVLELIYQIGGHELTRGMDIMEVAPPLETFDRQTTLVASAMVAQFVGAMKESLA